MIQHHSAVELIDRLEAASTCAAKRVRDDRREVLLALTLRESESWRNLPCTTMSNCDPLGPELLAALQLVQAQGQARKKGARATRKRT